MPNIDTLPFKQCYNLSGNWGRAYELIVMHTNEGPERAGSARDLAAFCASPDPQRPGYHLMGDSGEVWRGARDEDVPWGAGGVNGRALHFCIVGFSAQSPLEWQDPFDQAAFVLAADCVRQWGARYGIPVDRRYADAPGAVGRKGLCGHGDVSRYHSESMGHTDPGANFPWDIFCKAIAGPTAQDLENFWKLLAALKEIMDMEHGMLVDVVHNPAKPTSGYELDRWGGVTPFGGAAPVKGTGYWKGQDVARKLVITNWNPVQGYVWDLKGGAHPLVGTPAIPAGTGGYWPGGVVQPIAEL